MGRAEVNARSIPILARYLQHTRKRWVLNKEWGKAKKARRGTGPRLLGYGLPTMSISCFGYIHHVKYIYIPIHLTMSTSTTTARTVLHKADTRGHADHGWLKAWHSFSFANWHDPERMHFGALRVLNDDTIAAGKGFGTHPHDNMEIITIVTEGALMHKDSMGNEGIIKAGDVQVMSAGTGVQHSEFNPDPEHRTKLFQVWLFPRKHGAAPRYDQITLDPKEGINRFQQIVSPDPNDAGTWIGQDAWFQLGKFDGGRPERYTIKRPANGVYVLVVSGSAVIQGQQLSPRDAIGISGVDALDIITGPEGAELLLIDVPMHLN